MNPAVTITTTTGNQFTKRNTTTWVEVEGGEWKRPAELQAGDVILFDGMFATVATVIAE